MTSMDWLDVAASDAARRGMPDARAVLEGLARAATLLRDADWNDDASGSMAADAALSTVPPR